jgi:hypothetical protein
LATYKKIWFFIVFLLLAFVLIACSDDKNASNNKESNESLEQQNDGEESTNDQTEEPNDDNQEQGETPDDEEEGSTDDSEDVNFEVQTAPEDQGDPEVSIEADFTVQDNVVTVKGTSNLLPDTELTLVADPKDYNIFGGSWNNGYVKENGEFEIEQKLPDDVDGLVFIELTMEIDEQNDEIKAHYKDKIKSNYLRMDTDSEEGTKMIAFNKTVNIEENQTFSMTEPSWGEPPEDMGSMNVWIEPTVEKQGEYVVVKVKSNLLDGTYISVNADIPGYITTGFGNSSHVNPDGTAVIYIDDPEQDDRIEGLTEYELEISVNPSHYNQPAYVVEAYGENGENFEGDLAKTYDDKKRIEQSITITVE